MSLIVTDPWGVAPGARILPVRVFHVYDFGQGPEFIALAQDIIRAVQYVTDLRAADPSIRVINMSFGGGAYPCPCDEWNPLEQQAISSAQVAGIITFAATGNEAVCGGIGAPACVSSAVPVAANYDADWYPGQYFEPPADCADLNPERYRVVCFSNATDNCGYFLAAPGFSITVGGFSGDGTSQATAHCSGVAALMFDKSGACGSLTADLARTIIYNTATRQDWAYPWCQLPDQPKHLNALTAVNAVTAGSCSPVVGDLNCDSILDGSDLDGFSVCMTGPRTDPIGGGCTCADFPASPPDGDVDLHDFMYFQRLLGGGQSTAATVTLDLASPNAGQIVEPGGTVYWTVSATVSQGDNAGLAAISVDLVQDPPSGRLVDMSPATTVGTGMDGFVCPAGISNPETDVPGAGYGGTPVARNLRQIGGAQNTLGEAGDTGTGEDVIVDPGIGQSGPQIIAQGSFTIPLAAGTYVFRIENGLANVLDVVSPPPSPPAAWPVSAANVVLNSPSFSVIVPYDLAVPDFDRDGDVDQNDFALMQACYTGNTYTIAQLFPGGDCDAFDLDGDGHVKMRDPGNPTETLGDLDWLEKCASGPGIPADAECCDCDGHGYLDARDNPPDPWVNNFDYDCDGIQVLGRPSCPHLQTTNCDDSCPCTYNPTQEDSDDDAIGDACDPTPYGPPPPAPPPGFEVIACRSVRLHGMSGSLSIDLNPTADAANATIEPRQGFYQIVEIDLGWPADPVWSDLWQVQVQDGNGAAVFPVIVEFGNNGTDTRKVIITFFNDPEFPECSLLDQNCYTINLWDAIRDGDGDPPEGDFDCAIRMLAGDVDGDGTVEETDDEVAIETANGQTADASNMRLDLDTDGIITGIETTGLDWTIVHGLLGNTVICGEGIMGGSMMVGEDIFSLGGAEAPVGIPVSAAMVVHDTGASSVTLPMTGGTVSVDVLISTAVPIRGFEARPALYRPPQVGQGPAVDAANVASINAANWTELDNIMMSHGQPSAALTSYYDLTVLDWVWFATAPDGQEIMGSDIEPLLSEDPPAFITLVNDLTALDGPISTPAGEWFTTSATMGGSTRVPIGPGHFVAATLSITVSATPGTYHLTLSEARYVNIAYVAAPISTVQPLEIVIQGQ